MIYKAFRKILTGAAFDKKTPPSSAWEDFETGSPQRLTSGDTADFSVTSAIAHGGTYSITRGALGANFRAIYDASTTLVASSTFLYSGWVRLNSAGSTSCLGGICLFSGGNSATGYRLLIDRRNGTSGLTAGFQLRIDNSGTALAFDSAVTIILDTWYYLQLEWKDSGTPRLIGRLYDSDGTTLISTITSNNSTYSTNCNPAIQAFNTPHIDDLNLTT